MDENLNLDLSLDFEVPNITLQETTVGRLAGERVGVGNIYAGNYNTNSNEEREGWVCELVLASSGLRWTVGEGSEFVVETSRFKVVSILPKSESKRGQLVLNEI
jgi:hypothetical protein